MIRSCAHEKDLPKITPSGSGCKECLEKGGVWKTLRLCLTCGHVGCCDNSKNKHATKHWEETGHPVIQSFEKNENWKWCFIENIFMDPTTRCQSCGMPLTEELYGTESSGAKTQEYCKMCFADGKFTEPNLTLKEMTERTFNYLTTQMHMPEEQAKNVSGGMIPQLNRWAHYRPD